MQLVVEFAIRTVLIAAATAGVLRALKINMAAARHAAWTGVLGVMLFLPLWTVWGPRMAVRVLPPLAEQNPIDAVATAEVFQPPAGSSAIAPLELTAPTPPTPQTSRWNWKVCLFCIYLVGVGLLLLRLAVGTLQAHLLVRRACRRDDQFFSDSCGAPVTVGWFRPVVVLPEESSEWASAQLKAVLAHEQEHARRRDPLVQWLALLNRAVFWFHPLAWWLERKLAALAEDACDAAVLRRGHDPRLYSEYLINLARAVQRAGARLTWGTAIDGDGLAARIRRILDGGRAQRLSPRHAKTAAVLCGLAWAVFGACDLQRAQKAASGQLSMSEMERRSATERAKKSAETRALLEEAESMTPEQAAAKVVALKTNPQDERTYYQLMRYYEFHSYLKGKDALILWYIEHEPSGKVRPWNINPGWDRAGYEQGKRLWLANTKKPGASAEIYDRAAAFLQGADKPRAEEILLAGRRIYRDDTRWARLLGEHYAMALLGSAEPRTEYNVIRSFSVAEAQGRYAQSVRAELEKSTDSQILAQTAQGLTIWGRGRGSSLTAETLALAEFYAGRAVSLDAASELAQNINFRVRQWREHQKLMDLQELPAEEQKRLSDADRLRLVEFEMEQAWGPTFKTPNLDLASGKARELLDIATRIPNDPHSSYAIFQANIMLGKVALRKGHKRDAARYLLAAAHAPASEELRRSPMLMNLPRTLVDWGERDAAAQFLERIAPKTLRTKEFQDWAAQIRKGVNPDMRPIMVGCGQEPC